MTSKFPNLIMASNCNILQPKHLNSAALHNSEQRDKVLVQQTNSLGSTANFLSLSSGFINNEGVGLRELAVFNDTVGCSNGISNRKGPNTMAKRNARERNRVKLVNQGFQTLRQHIPEDYRVKKMSKVDILRCALYYIRSLEQKLQLPFLPDQLAEGLMIGGNSSAGDAYSFGEGNSSGQHLSYEQHISSMSKSTSSEVGDEGDSNFSFSDEEILPKDGIKKPRLARDHSPSSGMCSLKQEHSESYVYHQYKEETAHNKSTMRTDTYKSQIFMMVGGSHLKIAHGSAESHYLAVEGINPTEPQCVKEEMENNDENYHSQTEWDEKVGV